MKNFNSVLDEYIEYQILYLKPTTILNLKRNINKHIKPLFYDKLINEINDDDYLNWQKYIKELNYSEGFNDRIHSIIKGIFLYMNGRYNIENIPIKHKIYQIIMLNLKKKVFGINENLKNL